MTIIVTVKVPDKSVRASVVQTESKGGIRSVYIVTHEYEQSFPVYDNLSITVSEEATN